MGENSGVYNNVTNKEEEYSGEEVILTSTEENPTSNFIEIITIQKVGGSNANQ